MGLLDIFRKGEKTEKELPLKKRVKDMKCRKISYVDTDFSELASAMRRDPKAVLTLKPVNYYAVKNQYIMAFVYTSENYEENYIQFKRYDFEHKTDESDIYPLDFDTLSRALAKVGIII